MCRVRWIKAFVRLFHIQRRTFGLRSFLALVLSFTLSISLSRALFRSSLSFFFLILCWLILFFTQITFEYAQQIKLHVPPPPPTLFDTISIERELLSVVVIAVARCVFSFWCYRRRHRHRHRHHYYRRRCWCCSYLSFGNRTLYTC